MAMPTTRTAFETGASNIKRSRSVVKLSHSNTLTMNAGKLYPILAYSDVLPGDTHSISMSLVLRSLTPVAPLMWDAYLQCEFYWVPNKIVLHRSSMTPSLVDSNHSWVAFTGAQENLLNVGIPTDTELPSLAYDLSNVSGSTYIKSLGHYLDYPYLHGLHNNYKGSSADISQVRFNPFPMLAFYKVWSDFYREPNLWNPVTFSLELNNNNGYSLVVFTPNDRAGIKSASRYNIFSYDFPDVCREHGYFGSALPWPQRNATGVMLGLGQSAPIIANGTTITSLGGDMLLDYGTASVATGWKDLKLYSGTGPTYGRVGADYSGSGSQTTMGNITGTNLVADLSNTPGLSINSFRYAMALQGYYEALARYGNRYNDILRIYGVEIDKLPDDCVEYLGGKRIPITATQVTAMAEGSNTSLGQVGGMINVGDRAHYFTKSMNDFGTIIGVAFIRFPETNYNFLSRERSRIRKLDYWNPYFANIGETEVKKSELWIPCDYTSSGYGSNLTNVVKALFGEVISGYSNNNSFGFQEYGAEYRYHENTIHGEFHPVFGSLPGWTLLTNWDDIYGNSQSPTGNPMEYFGLGAYLNAETQVTAWDKVFVANASTAGFQFMLQCYFDWKAVRQVRQNSIPALLGHS